MTKQNQNQDLCTTAQLHSPSEHLPTGNRVTAPQELQPNPRITLLFTPQQASWSLSPSHAILRVPHHCPTLPPNALTLGTFPRGLLLKHPSCFIALASLSSFQWQSEWLSSHTDFIKPLLLTNPSVVSHNSSQNRPSQESYESSSSQQVT